MQEFEPAQALDVQRAVAAEARAGLLAEPRSLSPWLFYDEVGSRLFEQITELPEYYLTRAEREIFAAFADQIIAQASEGQRLNLAELGAGTAAKTGLLLRACLAVQGSVRYQPIDVSPTALDEAREAIERDLPGVSVDPRIANYVTEPLLLSRPDGERTLALYIGSSIGNFSAAEATAILEGLRNVLVAGDGLLLGTDLAPGHGKSVEELVAAYDDAAGVTAAFNRNVLQRLNQDLRADFDVSRFDHRAVWNAEATRMEMHLISRGEQRVTVPANVAGPAMELRFRDGDGIHTENSVKFTAASVADLLSRAGFAVTQVWHDAGERFAVTLARAV